MDEKQTELWLTANYGVNRMLWSITFFSAVVITILALFISQDKVPVAPGQQSLLFYLAVILAIAILIFRRTLFTPARFAGVFQNFSGSTDTKWAMLSGKIRRGYIVLWSMAEGILLIGFIDFILSYNLRLYLTFAVVGIYAILITFPAKKFLQACVNSISAAGSSNA